MNNKKFCIDSFQELRVLQRVFREAKFCSVADDEEISTSPIVADLFARLLNALVEKQVEYEGEKARGKWSSWLNMNDCSRDEWKSAKGRAQKNGLWLHWSLEEKKDYVEILFKPFILGPGMIEVFILETDRFFQIKSDSSKDS